MDITDFERDFVQEAYENDHEVLDSLFAQKPNGKQELWMKVLMRERDPDRVSDTYECVVVRFIHESRVYFTIAMPGTDPRIVGDGKLGWYALNS